MVTTRSRRDTEKTVPPDLAGFEFYRLMSYGISWDKLVLPYEFASVFSGHGLREVNLRVPGGGGRRVWGVKVDVNEYGDTCLSRGWREFAGANGLELGQLLMFRYDGAALLTVTVFEDSECQRTYQHDYDEEEEEEEEEDGDEEEEEDDEEEDEEDGAEGYSLRPAPARRSSGSRSGGMAAARTDPLFSVLLRKCHFGQKQRQYLQVPSWFKEAHGYTERIKAVVLQMRGESWTVNLKHSKRSCGSARTAFRYGWHQFCLDNALGLGDTCFFHAVREGGGPGGNDHALRVEVRKPDGTVVQ